MGLRNLYGYLYMSQRGSGARGEVDAAYKRFRDCGGSAHPLQFLLDNLGYESFCWPSGRIVRFVDAETNVQDLRGNIGITNGQILKDGVWRVKVKLRGREVFVDPYTIAQANMPDELIDIAKDMVREEMMNKAGLEMLREGK